MVYMVNWTLDAGEFQFNPVEHPFSAMPSPKGLAQGDGDSRTVKEHELPGEDDEEDAEVELGKGGEDEEDEEDEEDVEDDEVLISFLFAHLASILLDPRP
jgi:hypothetical protein